MFRALDPDGLVEIANLLARRGARIHREALLASTVLDRRGRTELARALLQIEPWATATAADLRWRADAIRVGQGGGLDLPALLRAEFAAAGLFAPGAQDAAFVTWLSNRPANREVVAGAVASISSWLSQGWLDWDVTNRDLHNIKTTLESLTSSELDQVLGALSPRQLQRWIAEMGHSLNGFSRAEKREVFALLAESSSGDSLRRVHDALVNSGGQTDLLDFGGAIQVRSPDAVIADFIAAVLAGDLVDRPFSLLAPGRAVAGLQGHDATRRAAGVILEHGSALPWLVADSLAAGEDPAPLIAALAHTTDGDQMAVGFVSAIALLAAPNDFRRMLADRHSDGRSNGDGVIPFLVRENQDKLLSAGVRFLAAAPEDVFTHLATIADPEGELTSTFWHQLVSRGDAASIATILEGLRGGSAVDLDRFSAIGTDPEYEYPHACNLAFAAATLNRGMSQSAQQAQGDIDAVARVAGVATTVVGLLSGGSAVAESLAGTGAGWTVETHATAVKNDIDNQLARLIDAATARLRPPDGVDLTQYAGAGNALLAWTGIYTRLLPYA